MDTCPRSVLLLVAFVSIAVGSHTIEAIVPYTIKETQSELKITFGDLTVQVEKSPWRMKVTDSVSGEAILTETSSERHKLGFGKWEGDYLNIYQGYLFRVGLITEWYHAEELSTWTNSSNSVCLMLHSSDPAGRYLNVTLTGFERRKFSMRVSLKGENNTEMNRMAMGFLTPNTEGFYGFGERFSDVNQRGHRVGSWLEDGSWGLGVFDPATWKLRVPKGEESTYCPMPILISTHGYALQLDTYYRTVFDLAKEVDGVMILEQETNALDIIFYMTTNPLDAFLMVIENNGRSLVPPAWEFSPWNQLQDEQSNITELQRIVDFFFKYDIPCSHAINTVHFFPEGGERGREEQLKKSNDELLALGVKTTAYFNAMLETSYTELYNYAASKGFLLETKDGLPYNYSYIGASTFLVSQVDYTNPEAMSWYQQQLARAVNLSFQGWMYDYGEYTPPDSMSSDGTPGLKMHNEFSHLYQAAAFNYLTTLDPDPTDIYAPDYVFYVRSAYTGSQRYTWAHWTGDPSSDWSYASGLPAQIIASLNIGLSGMPFSGSDIGGFEWYVDPVPDLELWARWTAAGCVSGLMHEQGGGKGIGQKSHIFDFPNGTAIWRKLAKLRMQLFPYIYTQAHIGHQTGLPIMRHHLLHFWNDSTAIEQKTQYMFGESFLAAPVVEESKTMQDVYLPGYGSGLGPDWMDVSSSVKFEESDGRYRIGYSGYHAGGQMVSGIPAPLDSVPLFVLAGSIITILDPRVMTLNNASNSSVITWERLKHVRHLWVFADRQFNASGHSWDNQIYHLSHNTAQTLSVTLEGSSPEFIHVIQIAGPWVESGSPVAVLSDGKQLPTAQGWKELVKDGPMEGFFFDKSQQVLWVRIVGRSGARIVLGSM